MSKDQIGIPSDLDLLENMMSPSCLRSTKLSHLVMRFVVFAGFLLIGAQAVETPKANAATSPSISNIATNGSSVGRYDKFEITFDVTTIAANLNWPFDLNPPAGITPGIGISVNAQFSPDNWRTVYTQPAFYYQDFDYQVKGGQDWIYPNGVFHWKVRFAPNQVGTWQFRLSAQDAGGLTSSAAQSVTVTSSSNKGFIRVSKRDSRYFEYEDGTYFPALGYNMNFDQISWNNPISGNASNFQIMGQDGIQLIRMWLSQWSIFGSQNGPWRSPSRGSDYDSLNMDPANVYPGSDASLALVWSSDLNISSGNPCMFLGWLTRAPAIKRNTSYHLSIRYRIPNNLQGPNVAGQPYGLVAKFGGWLTGAQIEPGATWRTNQECAYPSALINKNNPDLYVRTLTNYVTAATSGWSTLESDFTTDPATSVYGDFLPFLYLAVENIAVPAGGIGNAAFIDKVEIRENLGGGQRGPDILGKPSMDQLKYFDQEKSFAFDKALDLAKQNGIYLKPVVLEKNEYIQDRIDYNGNPVPSSPSNDFFYGNWGAPTKVYWLQQAWWRYLQARWGYSTNIHSWELLNEGDPYNGLHYSLAENFAKYMHQFAPDNHLVTTSTWHSFPESPFWKNAQDSDLDYADVHQYTFDNQAVNLRIDDQYNGQTVPLYDSIDTQFNDTAANTQIPSMIIGAKQSHGVGKPVMRGETGFVVNGDTNSPNNYFFSDTQAVWLHNFVWGQINPGGMIESYWYADYHIYNASQGFDHRTEFKTYYDFMKNIPLNSGNYQDAQATTSNTNLIAWGQKDPVSRSAHLWIANRNHTWRNVVNNVSIVPISGTVTIPGMPAGKYHVNWWNTRSGVQISQADVQVSSGASLPLVLPYALSDDIAVKVVPSGGIFLPAILR